MRRTAVVIASLVALAAVPAAGQASSVKPPNPLDLICGPTANCQVQDLPELPPVPAKQ
jgi:hypothetical protein